MLTADRLRAVLSYDPDTGLFLRRTKGIGRPMTCSPGKHGYVRIKVDGCQHLAHRLAWLYMTGEWPAGVIDHRNGNGADNRWMNLRDVTVSVNLQNQQKATAQNTNGLLGAHVLRRGGTVRFQSQIRVNGRRLYLGIFDTPEEAHAAYLAAKRRLHEGCTI